MYIEGIATSFPNEVEGIDDSCHATLRTDGHVMCGKIGNGIMENQGQQIDRPVIK